MMPQTSSSPIESKVSPSESKVSPIESKASPINVEQSPNTSSPVGENNSGSMWDNAMKGAQAATNYLLSFISSPPPTADAAQQAKETTDTHSDYEGNVLAAWQRKSVKRPIQSESKALLSEPSAINYPRNLGFEPILSESTLSKIHSGLAKRFQICIDYQCLYSTHLNGYSMTTLLRNCKEHTGPVLLAVRTGKGNVLGAFASQPWTPHMGHFGTGECFLFTTATTNNANNDIEDSDDGKNVMAYYTTGANDYYLFCDGTFLAAGVSEGKFGIWIDSELMNGTSSAVSTFDNPPLAPEGENFSIEAVEVWALSPP